MLFQAGTPRRGGRGVQWPRGPWTLGGPWASGRSLASAGPAEGPWAREGPIEMTMRSEAEDLFFCFFGDHLISTAKTTRISVKIFFYFYFYFFLEITSSFGQKCGIFSACFGVHKTGNPWYLSWPRAHVRLSAPLLPSLHSSHQIESQP